MCICVTFFNTNQHVRHYWTTWKENWSKGWSECEETGIYKQFGIRYLQQGCQLQRIVTNMASALQKLKAGSIAEGNGDARTK